ncbi:alpha/beta fold hydrolase [Pseudomarimonas arenosa]|uniref:Alpha/beta fold hydrolase n=1 Tax=Pseudomarimonas arenosa TaxID=2774145 RepID=A0AAW3ZRC5_9GAMM|nr:alpha/beta fold hydrolase [Pseudomarimonas arenosa]MBD8527159.1 alpha/beta fold hydrolase [Pseudomarimonas arenosa]
MGKRNAAGVVIAAVLVLLLWGGAWRTPGSGPPPPPAVPASGSFDPLLDVDWLGADCWFEESWIDRLSFARSSCGWLYPSTRDSLGQRAALPVVILHQQRFRRPTSRATVYVMGGPGGSSWLSSEGIVGWTDWSHRLGLDHDLVLYDQRGTGYSQPPLECPELESLGWDQLDSDADRDALWAEYERVIKGCAEQIPSADRAAGLYSTATNARDLRELIASLKRDLGYQQISVYGVSYGTRLAMTALADAAVSVDAVVLDSLYPPGLDLVAPFADHFAAVIDAAGRHCIEQQRCAGSMQLRELLDRVLRRLGDHPQRFTVNAAWLQKPVTLRIDDAVMITLVEHAMYAAWDLADLHDMLSGSAEGNLEPWREVIEEWLWVSMDPDFDMLTLHAVECRDNPPLDPAVEAAALARQPSWASALRSPKRSFVLCEQLGVSPRPLTAAQFDIPVLALAAEFDPRTPVQPGVAALESYPHVQWLRLPITGHGLVDVDECAAQSTGQFLNRGGAHRVERCGAR